MEEKIRKIINESGLLKEKILKDDVFISKIKAVVGEMIKAFKKEKKVLIAGNGGSAADAQHIAAELSGKFRIDRPPLNAEALHVNTSFLTAVANDYSYDEVFARLIDAKGSEGDIFIGISTSGKSSNIIKALERAKSKKMITVGFTGENTKEFEPFCDFILNVPSKDTPRIQEVHILLGHIICELVEESFFS